MHNILEGLSHNHFRKVLRLTEADANLMDPTLPAFEYPFRELAGLAVEELNKLKLKPKEITQVSEIHVLLTAPIEGGLDTVNMTESMNTLGNRLARKNLKPLQFVCRDLQVFPSITRPTVSDWVQTLLEWVSCPIVSMKFPFHLIFNFSRPQSHMPTRLHAGHLRQKSSSGYSVL